MSSKKKKNGKGKEKEPKPDPYAYTRALTDDEKKLVDALRAKLKESEHAEKYKGENVGELLRFLRARDLDVDKAWTMYSTHLTWRTEYKPDEIDFDSIKDEAKLRKIRLLPADKEGNVSMLLCAGKHLPGQFPLEHTLRYAVYMAEKTVKAMPVGQERFTFLYDRRGFTRKNFDRSLISGLAHLFEANYPERVAHVYVYQSDWLFSFLYAIVKPFLPAATVKKIKILDTNDLKGEMLKIYDEDKLWHRLGGSWHDDAENTSEEGEEKKKAATISSSDKKKSPNKSKGKAKLNDAKDSPSASSTSSSSDEAEEDE